MNRGAAIARVRAGLSFRVSAPTLNNEIAEAMMKAQRDLEMGKTLPKFLLQEDQVLSGLANDPNIVLPPGFLKESEEDGFWWAGDGTVSGFPRELERGDYRQLRKVWNTTQENRPFAYAIRKGVVTVFPTPSVVHEYSWSYYKADAVLSADPVENEWLLNVPDLIVAQAGLMVAADLHDNEALQKFQALQKQAQTSMFYKVVDDEFANIQPTMGGNN
jgi:hypothetical protein